MATIVTGDTGDRAAALRAGTGDNDGAEYDDNAAAQDDIVANHAGGIGDATVADGAGGGGVALLRPPS